MQRLAFSLPLSLATPAAVVVFYLNDKYLFLRTVSTSAYNGNIKVGLFYLDSSSSISFRVINPFPADVTNKRHLGSAKTEVIGLSVLMTLFIDLQGCLYCKQTQRAFGVFKNTLN
jgi:hypothetical protein